MALAHQWFIQWSSPAGLLADISTRYEDINNWKSAKPNVAWEVTLQNSGVNYDRNYVRDDLAYEKQIDGGFEKARSFKSSEASRLMLWLTMLGTARAQAVPADIETPPFSTLYKWKHIDFEFPSPQQRSQAIANEQYIPENVLPLGLEVWGSRIWVTLPSWRRGVPATLATIPRDGGLTSPPLRPYPDWSYHRAYSKDDNCSSLTSVFRVNADSCGRLWVLDSGQIDAQDQPIQKCPPSIFVFDLNTDTVINRFIIPRQYVLQDSLYSNIIVDTRTADCSDLHLYIADTWRFGLLVFREKDAQFWRFSHHLFYPDPLASNYTVHGVNFQWPDGIFGLSLSPITPYQERVLFFHSLSSYREFYVLTKIIRDPTRLNNSTSEFNIVGDSRGFKGQSSASAVDRNGVMYYGLVSQDSIGCWDTTKPHRKNTIGVVARHSETLVFPNDIKVDQDEQQSVWVISNKLPLFQARRLNPYDYNYRILFADTKEAVRGTICDPEMRILF
ncbi:hypothetical protein evm_001034 [Chilo suppressalis]|nr:hypothetical protein evm_001034 [Chilo suppressalis]